MRTMSWHIRGCKECHTPVGYDEDITKIHVLMSENKVRYAWVCEYCSHYNLRDKDGFIN